MHHICAGIVTYNADINRLEDNIKSIQCQVEKIYIGDNGSNNIGEISELVKGNSKLKLIYNEENLGIATALNQLSQAAIDDGFDWILTLDQDTISPPQMVEKMAYYTNDKELAIVCPAVNYEGWETRGPTHGTTYVYACMTSASLTRLEAWEKVGGFNDAYFIDFVDNEFCMKLKLAGYKILRVNSCAISHRLGEPEKIVILGKTVTYSRHAPWRYYYMIRNNKAFIDEYSEELNVAKEYLKLIYISANGIIFAANKLLTTKYILKGYHDGAKKIMGRVI